MERPFFELVEHYVRTAEDQAFFDEWREELREAAEGAARARRIEATDTLDERLPLEDTYGPRLALSA